MRSEVHVRQMHGDEQKKRSIPACEITRGALPKGKTPADPAGSGRRRGQSVSQGPDRPVEGGSEAGPTEVGIHPRMRAREVEEGPPKGRPEVRRDESRPRPGDSARRRHAKL